ncbi:hypothetical protein PV410_17025 [Streptomyces sp. PA03-5A]|nr:hypothetical protein [Streptomyces sp. PA03-5A]
MEGWKFWWGIAAFFLGGLATQLSGWITYRRQRADKQADAHDALRQRREDFELQHLIETNQKLHVYRERFWEFIAANRRERLATPEHAARLHSELNVASDALREAEGALHGNVGFILDDNIRTQVREAMQNIDAAAGEALYEGEDIPSPVVTRSLGVAFDALSERVRVIYAGRPSR